MGQKTHPIGFRLGIIKDWQTHWYAPKANSYRTLVLEDMEIRKTIHKKYEEFSDVGIPEIGIDRDAKDVIVNIHSARPGILIGRNGERVKELRQVLENKTSRKIQLNVIEVPQPELNAYLVGKNIAEQLERRVSYRRTMRQASQRAMQAGAKGIKIIVKGRIMGMEIARQEKLMVGQIPLHTLRADIDYGLAEANSQMGKLGIKVWIYKGEILPEPAKEPEEEIGTIEVTISGDEPPTGEDSITEDIPTRKVTASKPEDSITADTSTEKGTGDATT